MKTLHQTVSFARGHGPAPFFTCKNVAGDDLRGQQGRRKLGQDPVRLATLFTSALMTTTFGLANSASIVSTACQ